MAFDLFSLAWQSSSALRVNQRNLALTAANLAPVCKLGSRLSRGLLLLSKFIDLNPWEISAQIYELYL